MTPITPHQAVVEAGGVSALAGRLAVTRGTVHAWLRKKAMPESFQYMFLATVRKGKRV